MKSVHKSHDDLYDESIYNQYFYDKINFMIFDGPKKLKHLL